MTIESSGAFVATSANSSAGGTDTFKGNISSSGHLTGKITNTNYPGTTINATGAASYAPESSSLTITYTATYAGTTSSNSCTLTKLRSR
jgi:hypothetical protein